MLTSGVVVQNRYQVIRLLGQGGFGAVYQARDLRLGQIVALKENIGGDPRQFQQEALILANLRHPNLPRVSDHFVEPNGAQYLVMDFVEGEDLESVLQRQGALPEAQALAWFDQILDAVAYLHNHSVIHRDIKPANIKITPAGQAVLVDFGIAKVYQPGQMTMSGARAVSPGYAAPEQYRGGTDHQSDVYSLGATLYALLTGGEPPDARALERGTATLTPPRVLNLALSVTAEQIILQAMAIQVRQRFQSADAMRRAIKGMTVAPTLPAYQPSIPSPSTQPYVQPARVNVIGLASIMAVVAVVCMSVAIAGYIFVQLSTVVMPLASATSTRGFVLPTISSPVVLQTTPTRVAIAVPSATGVPAATTLRGKIAYSVATGAAEDQRTIYVADADGTDARAIIQSGLWPSLSPDGKQIAYYQIKDQGIYIANIDGSATRKIVNGETCCAQWSPDGKRLMYLQGKLRIGDTKIVIANPDGTGKTEVTAGFSPAWAPDGTRIVYTACQPGTISCGLYTLDLRMNRATMITRDDGKTPHWSPRGDKIVYNAESGGLFNLFLVNPDGSGRTQLTSGRGYTCQAVWSLDGNFIFFRSDQDGKAWGIFVMRTDGTGRRLLINNVPPDGDLWARELLSIGPYIGP